MSKWAGFLGKGAAILLLALPIPFVRFLLPEFVGQPFFMYMLVFLYGFVLMSDLRYGQALQDIRKAALLLAVVATTILMAAWISKREFPDFSLPDVLLFFLESFNIWFWIVAILGYGQRYLNVENGLLRYSREASYPFYILHQTVIVIIGYYVVQWSAAVLPKFLVIAGLSLAVTVMLYDVFVRRTNVTRFVRHAAPAASGSDAHVSSPTGRPAV
jgi:peptidoglycan/LPS O-acetylase OafA/YrhL